MGSDHGGTEGHWVHLHLCVQLNIHLWLPSTQKSKNLLNLSLPSPKSTVRSPQLTDYKATRNLVMSPGKPLLPKTMADRGVTEDSENGEWWRQKPHTALLLCQWPVHPHTPLASSKPGRTVQRFLLALKLDTSGLYVIWKRRKNQLDSYHLFRQSPHPYLHIWGGYPEFIT